MPSSDRLSSSSSSAPSASSATTLVSGHSDPVEAEATNLRTLVLEDFQGADGINWLYEGTFEPFWEFAQELCSGARGLLLW